ncbi:glycosyltransferase family 4 protein [Clostridium botulinum]|uniref:glycosyltransferase family 4 protein n=1 Tax=Clostridium sporogenes TaxID=1509 RepID=UPI002238A4E5|nr:glycosyltransferase family 4 protein [Clostridium sporogenes]MCW6110426.1 glycosyltransferase family 4 protein [Clostridium sporogenes]
MKICILGPVINDSHFGGVATFDEGLRSGFVENGNEILMITNIKKNEENIKYFNKRDFFIFKNKIIKEIEQFNPDIVVTSMWYGILSKSIKKCLPDTKIVQYIHGFPTYRYKIYKRHLLNTALKKFRKYSDFFVSNSSFTSCINTEIYGIKCDKTIHLGLKERFRDFEKKQNKKINFVFAGRIVKEKNVDRVCEIFNFISQFNDLTKLTILGDGPEKKSLKEKYESEKIIFVGKKSREETLKIFENSDIFISLNPHEPFGLVYLEALLKKCKIICPNTGGQVEFLNGFKEVLCIDINNFQNYKEEFIKLINLEPFTNADLSDFFDHFNYRRVAKELSKLK